MVEMHGPNSDSVMSERLRPRRLRGKVYGVWRLSNASNALGTLAIPATATDCERTFSGGRMLISPERNRLSDDIIETTECLKAWWDPGIIRQLTW